MLADKDCQINTGIASVLLSEKQLLNNVSVHDKKYQFNLNSTLVMQKQLSSIVPVQRTTNTIHQSSKNSASV